MSELKQYGDRYWCVKSPLSEDGEIYAWGDEVVVVDGAISIIRTEREGKPAQMNLALAAGNWTAVFAASVIDGHAVAVEHWKGEVARR